MLVDQVAKILEEKCGIRTQEKIVLGFSGGADSMCLLDILYKLGIEVVVAYFNHQLRPTVESEVSFVKKTAEDLEFEFKLDVKDIKKISKKTNRGIEETARSYRYQFLVKAAEDTNSDAVAVAHHADDQVETILMNLIRGSGLNGLTGMDYVSYGEFSKSIPIIRPLLDLWKDELESYCEENELNFVIDETNVDELFLRNRIRASLIPYLEKYNPKVRRGLIRMGGILTDDHNFITEYSEKQTEKVLYRQKMNLVEINIHTYKQYPISVQRYIISGLLQKNFNIKQKRTYALVENIRKGLNGETTSHYARLLQDLQVIIEKDRGYLFIDINDLENGIGLRLVQDTVEVKVPGITSINKNWRLKSAIKPIDTVRESFRNNKDKYSAFMDAKVAKRKMVIRKWKAGDRYAPLGLSGHSMKLSDFWINKYFPKRLRAGWPLLFSKEQLIWIPGFQPSYYGRITDSTKDVLQLKVEEKV